MTVHKIEIIGCDASNVLALDMTEDEYQTLLRLAEIANRRPLETCIPQIWVDDRLIGQEDAK